MIALLSFVYAQIAAADPAAVAESNRIIDQSIGMWRIENAQTFARDPVATFSPDGTQIVALVARGRVADGYNEFELRKFSLSSDSGSSRVGDNVVFRRSTTGNPAAISAVRWIGDGSKIVLLASVDTAAPNQNQVYVIDARTGKAEQRTRASARIISYGVSADGNTIVYAAQVPVDTTARYAQRMNGVVAAAGQPGFLFDADVTYDSNVELFVESAGNPGRRLFKTRRETLDYFDRSGFIEVSPDGRSAILGMHLMDSLPPRWNSYKAAQLRDFIDDREIPPPTYGLIDLQSGRLSLLIDAPSVWGGTTAAWSPDSRHVFVTGYLPLDSADSTAMRVGKSGGGVIHVDVTSRNAQLVTDGVWRIARVASRGDTVSLVRALGYPASAGVAARRGVSARTLVGAGGRWRMIDSTEFASELFNAGSAVTANDRTVVGINESVDRPPQLIAYDRRGKTTRVITSLNPTLKDLPRGAIRRVSWTSARGDVWDAHLVTPVGYVKGRRYPAVIMIMDMGYNDQYVLDGRFYKASYPIQALANRGIVVLMTYFPKVFSDNYVKPVEREIILSGTDGAFEYLVREGVADSAKIGITGFSHSGYVAQYAITHSRHRYAAAIAIDNFDGGYVGYVVFNHVSSMNGIDEFYGGNPFGPAMATWQKEAPGFTAQRVRTPVLFEEHGSRPLSVTPTSVVLGWESYTGLRRLGKPAELVRYTYGQHILEKPLERFSSMHRQVDWLTFWLKDEMDPAPSKKNQYQRWTAMRK
jgi:dipeptidyl aminopeptidase/acylaminoacyl peptidase